MWNIGLMRQNLRRFGEKRCPRRIFAPGEDQSVKAMADQTFSDRTVQRASSPKPLKRLLVTVE